MDVTNPVAATGHCVSLAALAASLLGILPPVATVLTIVWMILNIIVLLRQLWKDTPDKRDGDIS